MRRHQRRPPHSSPRSPEASQVRGAVGNASTATLGPSPQFPERLAERQEVVAGARLVPGSHTATPVTRARLPLLSASWWLHWDQELPGTPRRTPYFCPTCQDDKMPGKCLGPWTRAALPSRAPALHGRMGVTEADCPGLRSDRATEHPSEVQNPSLVCFIRYPGQTNSWTQIPTLVSLRLS